MGINIEEVVLEDQVVDSNLALGKDEYKWTSPDGTLFCTFGRVSGPRSSKVARLLGPDQSSNSVLELQYKALMSIRTWCGEPVNEPMTINQMDAAEQRFESDINLNSYIMTWQYCLFPEYAKAMEEAGMMKLLPEDVRRIAENAGKETAKKSQRHGSSRKS